MTPEERALELYPVEYQDKVGRKHPDRNLPFRRAFLEGYKIGYREGFVVGYEQAEKGLALTAAEVGCIVSLNAQLREDYPDRETRHARIAEIINQDRKEEKRKIGLIDVDGGKRSPNIVLMKIIDHLKMIKMGCVVCAEDTSEEIDWLKKEIGEL